MLQLIYAHYTKLLVLFTVAIIHAAYMKPFLDVYAILADYEGALVTAGRTREFFLLRQQVDILTAVRSLFHFNTIVK